jgi:hypothetical protein
MKFVKRSSAQVLVCAILTIAAPAFAYQEPSNQNSYLLIAVVEQWNARPFTMLKKNGFAGSSSAGGDRGVSSVVVPKSEAARAYKLLTRDSKKYHYWLSIRNPQGKWETFFKKNDVAYQAWLKKEFAAVRAKADHSGSSTPPK